jgi:glycosyltransferase involved in cell wall biosynthesis
MESVVLSSNTSWYLYNYRKNTIRAFREKGFRVICLSPEDDYSARLTSELGAVHYPLEMDNQGNNPLRDLLLFFRFLIFYTRIRPRAIFHFTIKNNVYGTIAAALLRVPAINNVSGLGTAFIHSSWVSRAVRGLYRISQPLAFRVFCQNREDFALLQENHLVPPAKLFQLPGSGVDLEHFRPQARREHNHSFRFLFLGRMLADKGLYELVEAFRRLQSRHQAELWLAGSSEARNSSAIDERQLRAWQAESGIRWLGHSDNPRELLAQADCVVLPSYREGLPRSLLEGNAMALPAITCDVPGCNAVIRHDYNGLLCSPRDVDSLFEAMNRMVTMPAAERERMGQAGLDLVRENYSETIVIDQYLKALDDAMATR